jgi:hypothetical protein
LDLAGVAEFADQSGDVLDPSDPIRLCPSGKGVLGTSRLKLGGAVGVCGFFDPDFSDEVPSES